MIIPVMALQFFFLYLVSIVDGILFKMFNKKLQIIQKLELVLEFGIFIEKIENENQNRNNNICITKLI